MGFVGGGGGGGGGGEGELKKIWLQRGEQAKKYGL